MPNYDAATITFSVLISGLRMILYVDIFQTDLYVCGGKVLTGVRCLGNNVLSRFMAT